MGLEWHEENDRKMNWQEAIDYCKDLGDSWRLPTIQELISLIAFDKFKPASLLDMKSSSYWSSTTNAHNSDSAWYVHFNYGYVYYVYKSDNLYVRAVRGEL